MTLDQDIAYFSEYNSNITAINARVNSFLNLLDAQVNANNHLFVRRAGAYGSFVGRVRKRIYTNGIPSTDLIDKTVGYLAHKRGLSAKLEETHPYKYIIP